MGVNTAWPESLTARASGSAAKKACLVLVTADLTAGTVLTFSVVLPLSFELIYLRVLLQAQANLRCDLVLGL